MENNGIHFVCFQKISKNNKPFFAGDLEIDGKKYRVCLFEKVSKNNDRYLSGQCEINNYVKNNVQDVANEVASTVSNANDGWGSAPNDTLDNDIPF